MNEYKKKIGEFFSQKSGKDKRSVIIILLGIIGMLCLLLSGGGREKKEFKTVTGTVQTDIEKELEGLLKTVDGVGKVKVFVTFESMTKNVYAVNSESVSNADGMQRSEKYVFRGSGSDSDCVLLYNIMPEVRGVAVSCEGGGSSVIRQEITRLISASLGINTNNIWVSKMDSDR